MSTSCHCRILLRDNGSLHMKAHDEGIETDPSVDFPGAQPAGVPGVPNPHVSIYTVKYDYVR
jgi:hypothetical protein